MRARAGRSGPLCEASRRSSSRCGSAARRCASRPICTSRTSRPRRREAAASGKSGATPSKPPVDGVARSSLLALSAARVLLLTLFLLSVNDGAPTGGAGARAGEAAQAKTEKASGAGLFMLLIVVAFFIALPQLATAGANRALHLGLEVQSPRFQLLTGRLQADNRRRLPALPPPHPRHPADVPVPRRRAQDDQHLRGRRRARARQRARARRPCTRAAGRRSS